MVKLTNAARPATFEVEAYNERGEMVPTAIAGEHPLTLYLDKREIVTLMTLGHAPEALAIGYLRNQRLVASIDEIDAVQVDWETDSVAVTTRKKNKQLKQRLGKRTVTTGCGQGTMFGDLMDEIDEGFYFSGDDVTGDAELRGLISFNFACYGAGMLRDDAFSRQAFAKREAVADRAFVAGLHRRLLGHPRGGALAAIGHVERVWGYSFMWGTGRRGAQDPQLAVFESTLRSLMKGMPVGLALEYFNERYAEMASDLSSEIEQAEHEPENADPFTLASMWTSMNDARGYTVVGDPAVRLQLAGRAPQPPREAGPVRMPGPP